MARLFFNLQYFQRYLKLSSVNNKKIIRSHKTISGDKITKLDDNTLTGRFLIYLNDFNVSNAQNELVSNINHINLQISSPNHYNLDQIKTSIQNLEGNSNFSKLSLFKEIDKECTKYIKDMKTSDIFTVLHLFMKKVPNRMIEYKFYQHSMKELSIRLNNFDKNELIQYMFFIGLTKTFTKSNKIKRCFDILFESGSLDILTVEDICIICNSTFKTSSRINNKHFLSKVITYLYDNLQLFKDSAYFITFLKSIRYNRYQDEELLATMTSTIFFNKTIEHYSFSSLCHILAVYSDYLYYDENILKLFTERCINFLRNSVFRDKKEHMSIQARLKDIKRLLWCLSNLNCNGLETSDIKNVIIPNILQRLDSLGVEENLSCVIEITLYLWMLNYRAYELVPYLKKNVRVINDLNIPTKQRLNLLLTCMFYEDKDLLKEIGHYPKPNKDYNMSRQLEKRPVLQKVLNILNRISNKHKLLNRFELGCQVPGINIIGITGYTKGIYKTVYIEVLDNYTTLKNTKNLPTGLMQLKLRLMEHLQEGVTLIDSDEIESMNDNDIQELLLDEIEFVC